VKAVEIKAILAEALNSIQRARSITPRSHLELSALRWELYAALQNTFDAMPMIVAKLGLRKPPSYAGLGLLLREEGLIEEHHAKAVSTLAYTGNVLAHAYRRLGEEDLKAIVDKVLPDAEGLIDRLLKILEDKREDPCVMNPPVIEKIREVFIKHEVAIAYLFGSRARGTEREDSDYDIAVLFQTEDVTILDEAELAKELASALGVPVDKVDIVALNRADSRLIAKVLEEGAPLYYKSNEDKTRWELKTYLNLLKSIDLDSTYLARTLKKITGKKKE